MVYSYLPYAITELFCIAFAVTILFRLNGSIGSEHEIMQLKRMVYAYLGLLATDIVWALGIDGFVVLDALLNATNNAITIICISAGCFFWFKYVEDRLRQGSAPRKYEAVLTALPLIGICVLDVLSIFTGWLFFIDENNQYQTTSLFWIQTVVNYAYLLIPTFAAIRMAGKTNSKSQRHEYLSYPLYMIVPLICGMLEDVVPNVPIIALNIFMVILLFFLAIQSRQVSTDALTGLNNRTWLNQYLEKTLYSASTESPVTLFMMNIENFKSINSSYGHVEGDNALKSFAAALRLMAARYNAFVARYGGDVFCLVTTTSNVDPIEIEFNITETLQTVEATIAPEAKPYTLSIDIGYAICDHSETRVIDFIDRANDVLHEDKEERAK